MCFCCSFFELQLQFGNPKYHVWSDHKQQQWSSYTVPIQMARKYGVYPFWDKPMVTRRVCPESEVLKTCQMHVVGTSGVSSTDNRRIGARSRWWRWASGTGTGITRTSWGGGSCACHCGRGQGGFCCSADGHGGGDGVAQVQDNLLRGGDGRCNQTCRGEMRPYETSRSLQVVGTEVVASSMYLLIMIDLNPDGPHGGSKVKKRSLHVLMAYRCLRILVVPQGVKGANDLDSSAAGRSCTARHDSCVPTRIPGPHFTAGLPKKMG